MKRKKWMSGIVFLLVSCFLLTGVAQAATDKLVFDKDLWDLLFTQDKQTVAVYNGVEETGLKFQDLQSRHVGILVMQMMRSQQDILAKLAEIEKSVGKFKDQQSEQQGSSTNDVPRFSPSNKADANVYVPSIK